MVLIETRYVYFFSVQLEAVKILVIAPIIPEQISEIVALDRLCFGGLWSEAGYLREVESPNSTLLALSVRDPKLDSNSIIGIGCLWSIVEEAHITLLGIHPDYQQQGLGQLLLCTLLQDALARDLKWATLEVKVDNQRAINLYQKFDFQIIGKRKGYYQPEGKDALILWNKNLSQPEFPKRLSDWQKTIESSLSNRYVYKMAEKSFFQKPNT
jgi:[ribosomal protein S18]-alanine N-acetyltransferase